MKKTEIVYKARLTEDYEVDFYKIHLYKKGRTFKIDKDTYDDIINKEAGIYFRVGHGGGYTIPAEYLTAYKREVTTEIIKKFITRKVK